MHKPRRNIAKQSKFVLLVTLFCISQSTFCRHVGIKSTLFNDFSSTYLKIHQPVSQVHKAPSTINYVNQCYGLKLEKA